MATTSHIFKAKTIGFCFLAAFLAYGFGRYYFESIEIEKKYLGGLFIMLNTVIVISIGVLFNKTLKKYSPVIGKIYLFTRIIEGLALASVVLNFGNFFNVSIDLTYFIAMLVLGFGSIPVCFILYKQAIIPRWLSIWGMFGYTLFSFGFLMEIFGKEWSMYLLGLAGLWEIVFGIWLISRKNIK